MDIAVDVFKIIDKVLKRKQGDCPYLADDVKIATNTDIAFADEAPCRLDTFFVRGKQKYPVLFYIHGGGFVAGDKKYRKALAQWYASNGFFVLNVNYGLCPEYKFPEPLIHLAQALNWACDNAEALGLDLDKMIVSGDSAGGYYAAMLAAMTYDKELQKLFGIVPKARFGAAVLNCGLYDLKIVLDKKMLFNMDERVFEHFTGVSADDFENYAYKDACVPVDHVTKEFPPTFLIYAQKDIFCGGQAEKLMEKFDREGVYYQRVFSPTLLDNHCYCLEWRGALAEVTNMQQMDFAKRFANGTLQP